MMSYGPAMMSYGPAMMSYGSAKSTSVCLGCNSKIAVLGQRIFLIICCLFCRKWFHWDGYWWYFTTGTAIILNKWCILCYC